MFKAGKLQRPRRICMPEAKGVQQSKKSGGTKGDQTHYEKHGQGRKRLDRGFLHSEGDRRGLSSWKEERSYVGMRKDKGIIHGAESLGKKSNRAKIPHRCSLQGGNIWWDTE